MLTRAQHKRLSHVLEQAGRCVLGDWDEQFVADMAARLKRFGHELTVTDRQWIEIDRIEGKHL